MVLRLLKKGEVYGVPRGTLVRGDLAAFDGTIIAALGEVPLGIVMDDAATDDPLAMVDLYGEGSIIEDTGLSLAVDDLVYSDGDGTFSDTEPAGAAGTRIVAIGVPVSPTAFRVTISPHEKGA